MSRIFPQCLGANPSGRSARSDVLLREEPNEEEDEEEDDPKEDDEDEDTDDGYSSEVPLFSQWVKNEREEFVNVAEETLDSLPEEFQSHIRTLRSSLKISREPRPPKLGQRRQCF